MCAFTSTSYSKSEGIHVRETKLYDHVTLKSSARPLLRLSLHRGNRAIYDAEYDLKENTYKVGSFREDLIVKNTAVIQKTSVYGKDELMYHM